MKKILISLFLLSVTNIACMTQKDKEIYAEVFGPTPEEQVEPKAENQETPKDALQNTKALKTE